MKTLGYLNGYITLNAVMLWGIVGMNFPDVSKGLVAWTFITGAGAILTQIISAVALCSCEGEGKGE